METYSIYCRTTHPVLSNPTLAYYEIKTTASSSSLTVKTNLPGRVEQALLDLLYEGGRHAERPGVCGFDVLRQRPHGHMNRRLRVLELRPVDDGVVACEKNVFLPLIFIHFWEGYEVEKMKADRVITCEKNCSKQSKNEI